MNLPRIYRYRFAGIDQARKNVVWKEIAEFLYATHLGRPTRILDPAGGFCEFINHVPAAERWTIDLSDEIRQFANSGVKTLIGDNRCIELPDEYFDAVFISNFLEHLTSQEEVAAFLERMCRALCSGGRIVVMGPNFRYTYRDYFNFADHTVILTETGLAEHIYGAGFEVQSIVPRFLPLSFRSRSHLPISPFLIRTYLKLPLAWKLLGQQFLVTGRKP